MIEIPSSPLSITYLKKPIIAPGTPLPDWVVEKIWASETPTDDEPTTFDDMFENSEIDATGFTGAVGQWVEEELASLGYPINQGKGIDLPPYNIEIKTRKRQATSAQSFGSMKLADIIRSPWHRSDVKSKCQLQYQVVWDAQHMIVCEDRIVDLRHPWRQEMLQKAFDDSRNEIIEYYSRPNVTAPLKNTCTTGGIYLELTTKKKTKKGLGSIAYQFRVRRGLMDKWEIAGRKNAYEELFAEI